MIDIFSDKLFLKNFSAKEAEELCNKISLVNSINSTNTFLIEKANELCPLINPNGTITENGKEFNYSLKASESQTKGRGRLGRTFVSPVLSGIYFSIAYVKEGGITDPALVTVSACTGICRAIEKSFGISCKIKWVNDVYYKGKKVCGILTEGIVNAKENRIDACVIGIGINLRTNGSFDDELKNKAGGILDAIPAGKETVNRVEFLASCYKEIKKIFETNENIIEEYKSRSILTGKTVTVIPVIGDEKNSYTATVKGISDKAELIVQLSDGSIKNLSSGEVSLHSTVI